MWCKTSSILISFVVIAISGNFCLAACPSADLTGDCFVDFNDFALLAIEWPATDYNDLALLAAQWLAPDPRVPDDMSCIPGGTFAMGDSLGDGSSDELPVHTVTLDSLYMGKYKITNGQYCDFLNWADDNGWITVAGGVVYKAGSGKSYPYCSTSSAPSDYPHYGEYAQISYSGGVFSVRSKSGRSMSNDPMVCVSWYGAVAYCNWRSQQEVKEQCYNLSTWTCDFSKHGYRLATEAEWEYGARGGLAGRRFPWGDTITHTQANYYSLWVVEYPHPYYPYDTNPTEGNHPLWNDKVYPYTSPVGSFPANGYGLYDMAGNVWEWCNDWCSHTYYSSNPTNNPTGPTSTSDLCRVLRGGYWGAFAYYCRVAVRISARPEGHNGSVGFRLVLDIE